MTFNLFPNISEKKSKIVKLLAFLIQRQSYHEINNPISLICDRSLLINVSHIFLRVFNVLGRYSLGHKWKELGATGNNQIGVITKRKKLKFHYFIETNSYNSLKWNCVQFEVKFVILNLYKLIFKGRNSVLTAPDFWDHAVFESWFGPPNFMLFFWAYITWTRVNGLSL